MDFKKLSTFILFAGFLVFLYGLFIMLTNQPITTQPNSGNVFKDINQSIANIGENINKEIRREDAKKEMLIGGIILFVGIAIRMSSKGGHNLNEEAKSKAPLYIANVFDKRNILALVGGGIIVVSFFLPFFHLEGRINKLTGISELSLNTQRIVYVITHREFGRPENRSIAKDGQFVEMSSDDAIIEDVLTLVFTIVGWSTLLGSVGTIFIAVKKHNKTVLVALITSICGLSFFLRYFYAYINLPEEYKWTFNIGFIGLILGTILLLVSAGVACLPKIQKL